MEPGDLHSEEKMGLLTKSRQCDFKIDQFMKKCIEIFQDGDQLTKIHWSRAQGDYVVSCCTEICEAIQLFEEELSKVFTLLHENLDENIVDEIQSILSEVLKEKKKKKIDEMKIKNRAFLKAL